MTYFAKQPRNPLRRTIIALLAVGFIAAAATGGGPQAQAQTPPAEDLCAGALTVSPGGGGVQTSNFDATLSGDDPLLSCAMGPGFGSVFFTFVASDTSALVRTDLDSLAPDADFAVYAVDQIEQCDTSLWAEVGCSEDNDATFVRNTSSCIDGLVIGETYKIMLLSYTAGSSGEYSLQIDGPCEGGGDGGSEPPGPAPDTTPPVVTAPADMALDATGSTTAVAIGLADTSDNVGVVWLSNDAPDNFPIGTTVVTWTAADAAGNLGTATQEVTLVYLFGQFLPPLEDGGTYKANRTLPVKFQLSYLGGEAVAEIEVAIEVVLLGADDSFSEPIDLSTNESADSGGLFRFADGEYSYNLSTKGFAPGRYRIAAILSNGQAPFINIVLK